MQTLRDRVAESTTSTGTGAITLAGNLTGCRTFSSVAIVQHLFPYLIEAVDANGVPTGDWETGIGDLSNSTTLNRRFVVDSSTGSTVNFAAGTKYVYLSPIALSSRLGSASRFFFVETDFIGAATADTGESSWAHWDLSLISTGTQTKIASTANHPGILQISSSTTANSGAYIRSDITAFIMGGGEFSEFIFRPVNLTNTTARMGFIDTGTSTAPTDGVFFEAAGATLVGICRNNNTQTATSTLATLTANTWYRGVIAVNYNATSVWFGVYDESGTLLGSGTVTTNIPTAAGRETGHGVIFTNSGTTAQALYQIDYMNVGILRPLTR